jgi:hypothetical protein
MKKLKILTVTFGILALFVFGCGDQQNPIDSSDMTFPNPPSSPLISLPSGAVLNSATLILYVNDRQGGNDHHINVHRVTVPWDEATVTYNSLGGGYDPAVAATYTSTAGGWHTWDITSLVQSWLDGTYPDYGILIEQPEAEYTRYASSEYGVAALRPMLEICYTLGGVPDCITIQRGAYGNVSDALIVEIYPNGNYGGSTLLYTRTLSGTDKQSLFKFDVEVVQELAAIGDTVWFDDDQDGIQDTGELGFPGVTVNLYDCGGTVPIATATTDADGFYKFDGLTPGDYFVEFIEPEGYDITLQDQGGDDADDSDADPVTGRTICTTLDAGEYDPTWDCGLYMIPQDGCTLTIGYWKNHAGFGPQPDMVTALLPIWLGDVAGTESIHVTTAAIAVDILSQDVYGVPSNGITKLYAQLLGAKLNIANGASGSSVGNAINNADEFLADHDWTDWDGLSNNVQKMILRWHKKFDEYNNGLIGPGHCDD